jgi:hypothetical protein
VASPEGTRGIIVKQDTYECLVGMRDDINEVLAEVQIDCKKASLDDVIKLSLGVHCADPMDENGRTGLVHQYTLFLMSRSLGLPYDPHGNSLIDWLKRRPVNSSKSHT